MAGAEVDQGAMTLAETGEAGPSLAAFWLQLVRHMEVLASVRRELDEENDPSPKQLAGLLEVLMADANTTRHRVLQELELERAP